LDDIQHLTCRGGETLAYRRVDGEGPTVVWIGGFRSDMEGTKAMALDAAARERGWDYVRYDHFAHGQSSGDWRQARRESAYSSGSLVSREPWRQIAVLARTPEHARRLHAELARGLDPVLVLDGDFQFEPGIVVTTIAAVSGLEFDVVVIPDLTPAFYPVGPELARALYVGATRARDWLWLLTPDVWSPLVASAS